MTNSKLVSTIKLYDKDAYATEFDAVVVSAETVEDGQFKGSSKVYLDQTLFFPEEGGQEADFGTLNGQEVLDVQIEKRDGSELIIHVIKGDFKEGDSVHGVIDWDHRFDQMQQHSGEHIFSGTVHNKYGYDFDMNLTFKTEVRKKYFYKVEKGEKFVTEARLYYLLDQLYDGMVFKDIDLVYGEYMNEGYSKNINKIFKKYPKGYREYFKECLGYIKPDTKFKRRLYFIKHYILFSYLTKTKKSTVIKEAKGLLNKILTIILVIPGYIKSKKF